MIDPRPRTAIDHSRRSVSIPRRLVPSILAIHSGRRPEPADTLAELRACGVMATERLDPLVTTLVEVMMNPTLVITVELARDSSPQMATFWSTSRRAVIGRSDDRRHFQLIQVEPTLLPFHLAQVTGVRPRPALRFEGSFSIPAAALTQAESSVGRNPARAETALRSAGVPDDWARRFRRALARRGSVWTAESIWLGPASAGDHCRLTVLDAGRGGYWRLSRNDGGNIVATTTDFEDLMRRFADLMPRIGPAR